MSAQQHFNVVEILMAFLGYLSNDDTWNEVDIAVREAVNKNRRLIEFVNSFREILGRIVEQLGSECSWRYSIYTMRFTQYPIDALTRAQILGNPQKAEAIVLNENPWSVKTILFVDRETERVWFEGNWIILPRRQFSILYAILRHNGQVRMKDLCLEVSLFENFCNKEYDSGAAQMALEALVKTMSTYGPFELTSINDKFCLKTNDFLLIDCLK